MILNPIFILDNKRIHHFSVFKTIVDNNDLTVKYLPPYSPFINIIQGFFSKLKNYVIRKEVANELELFGVIQEGFYTISSADTNGLCRNMLRYIELSKNKEIIGD
ncbi:hypothetical protein DMUE_1900 [Dictyocoela muelleri]|nr:hypothetical protein DMUE_1900 [Dictyocoela muelleri]